MIFGHVSLNSCPFLDADLQIISRAFSNGLLIHSTSNLIGKLVIVSPGMMGLTCIDKLLLEALNPSSSLSPICLNPHTTRSPVGNVHSQMSCYIWSNILFSCQIWWKIMMYILFLKDIQRAFADALSHWVKYFTDLVWISSILFVSNLKKDMTYTLFLKDIQYIVMHTYVSGLSHQWFL